MIFVETPTNPMLILTDLKAVAEIAKKNNLITVCDNTFMSPYFQNPLEWGIDIVLHSTTKYLNGHSDMVGGILVTSNEKSHERLRYIQNAAGGIPSPFDCWLVLRSTKTLAVRYSQVGTETLRTALGTLHTVIIERPGVAGEKDAETLRVWLAPERGNLPVKIATVKRGEDTSLEIVSVNPPNPR